MAMTYTASDPRVDDLLAAVQRLPPEKLRQFARRFAEWQEHNGGRTSHEAALVRATRMRLPPADGRRLKQLIDKSERGTLSAEELPEYQSLAQRAEEVDVARAQALAELVRLRGKPARVVMQEVGWESGNDDA